MLKREEIEVGRSHQASRMKMGRRTGADWVECPVGPVCLVCLVCLLLVLVVWIQLLKRMKAKKMKMKTKKMTLLLIQYPQQCPN